MLCMYMSQAHPEQGQKAEAAESEAIGSGSAGNGLRGERLTFFWIVSTGCAAGCE
jgi:hypothetical protein